MIINFTKLSPGGNDTIIVQSVVPTTDRATVAQTLMNDPAVGGEHVGYLTLATASGIDARLDMMGGEFCVNGLRSAATTLASQTGKIKLRLASSGTDEIFECICIPQEEAFFTSITLNLAPSIKELSDKNRIVYLDGIAHLLCEFAPEATVEPLKIFNEMRQRYVSDLATVPAFGIIPFQRRKDGYEIFPVVYVRATDTIIPETGCGSGSVALALATIADRGTINVQQPSGCLYCVDVRCARDNALITLAGDVRILQQGTYSPVAHS